MYPFNLYRAYYSLSQLEGKMHSREMQIGAYSITVTVTLTLNRNPNNYNYNRDLLCAPYKQTDGALHCHDVSTLNSSIK